ncbi:uncharacterized protein [Tursiops truncatus]|uniref:uncharacterized protein isoform X3 n=1 Tax=Tursiops truncatus TaxID=9739 RepID=UPI003CCFAEF4
MLEATGEEQELSLTMMAQWTHFSWTGCLAYQGASSGYQIWDPPRKQRWAPTHIVPTGAFRSPGGRSPPCTSTHKKYKWLHVSGDCLYLNVYVPVGALGDPLLPINQDEEVGEDED